MDLGPLPAAHKSNESAIERFLIVLHADRGVDVWVNEPKLLMRVVPGRTLADGEAVLVEDLLEIETVVLDGIKVPSDAGVIALASHRWRKALYYDVPEPGDDRPDVGRMLAEMYAYIMFRSRFAVTETEWNRLLVQRWFLFSSLPPSLLD